MNRFDKDEHLSIYHLNVSINNERTIINVNFFFPSCNCHAAFQLSQNVIMESSGNELIQFINYSVIPSMNTYLSMSQESFRDQCLYFVDELC